MANSLYNDLLFILLATIVAAFLGFLIGWFLNLIKINSLKTSLDACYKENELLKANKDLEFESSIKPVSKIKLSTTPVSQPIVK